MCNVHWKNIEPVVFQYHVELSLQNSYQRTFHSYYNNNSHIVCIVIVFFNWWYGHFVNFCVAVFENCAENMVTIITSCIFRTHISGLYHRVNLFINIFYEWFRFRETLRDVVQMLRNTGNPQVEYIVRVMKKWAKENRVPIMWTS